LLNGFIAALLLSYPVAVYFSIQYFSARIIAAVLLLLLLVRLRVTAANGTSKQAIIWVGIVFSSFVIWNNDLLTLRFYPVLVSVSLLSVFVVSLFIPPPIIERLARLQHPQLPPEGVVYTRKVTVVWSVFFLLNGCIALYTALWSSFEEWTLYNGLISYVLMGILIAVEYGIRILTQKHLR
jgi:uncharacterized membrane protein